MCTANGEVRGLGLYFYFILVFFLFTRHTQLLWDWEKRGVAGWNVVCPSERVLMLPDKGSTNGDSIIIYVKCIHVDHFFISNRKSRSNHFINFSIGILSPQGQHRREKRNWHPFYFGKKLFNSEWRNTRRRCWTKNAGHVQGVGRLTSRRPSTTLPI